jgi:hypothetical protein
MTTTAAPAKPFPFNKAKEFVLRKGPFAEKSLDQIAKTEGGLCYLDNLRGKIFGGYFGLCLETYLDDPTIAKDLQEIIAKRNDWRNSDERISG